MIPQRQNWAGNYTYKASDVIYPETVEQVVDEVNRANQLRALGTRHSFNDIADTPGRQISLEKLNRIVSVDPAKMTVTVESGVKYGHLGQFLHDRGYALHNLASLPHISVAGACATATHGSGDQNGNLATAVVALELVTGDGRVVSLSRQTHRDTFSGMVVALGALGILTKLTLKIVPTFSVNQLVYENLPWSNLWPHFDEIFSSAYSVSLFTDWHGPGVSQTWRKSLCDTSDAATPPATFFGATPAPKDRHPITSLSAENCTAQGGVPGPWHQRLPHFRMEYTPSSGQELQSEYFVPRKNASAALQAILQLGARVRPHLFISEIRSIAADDFWISPCRAQSCIAIHFTWKQDWEAVRKLLPVIEQTLQPLEARPHWGKLFTMPRERIAVLYPMLGDFQKLAKNFDPGGKFRNEFMNRYIFG